MSEHQTVAQLKTVRTTAKRSFSRLVNHITRAHDEMCEEELKESFKDLATEAKKVFEANDDLEAGLVLELETGLQSEESEEAELPPQQKADLEKTEHDCEVKLKEAKAIVQKTLWAKYGSRALSTALQAAETERERVSSVHPNITHGAYEFMLSHLQSLTKNVQELHTQWQKWIPQDVENDYLRELNSIKLQIPALTARKAEFIQAKEEDSESQIQDKTQPFGLPIVKLKPTQLPRFHGNKRAFFRWRMDWEALQRQGEPTGSKEVKKVQLLDSIDERVVRDLRLSSYNTAEDIFRVLENRFGNRTSIAIEIVEELQRIPAIKGNQPRKIVELIQAVEKALTDLCDLGDTGAIKNPLVTKSIESKLPDSLKKDWLVFAHDDKNMVMPNNRFDCLLTFLKEQESIYEQLEQLKDEEPSKREPRMEPRHVRTKSTHASNQPECVVCGDPKHSRKLYFCKKFHALQVGERKAAARKLGACVRCLEVHNDMSFCKPTFLCKKEDCTEDGLVGKHHYLLCPNQMVAKATGRRRDSPRPENGSRSRYTEAQEAFLKTLSPELAKQCRDAFSNAVSKTCSTNKQSDLLTRNGLKELPVIMMLLEVTANAGQKIGTLIDLASDTNYITHKAAKALNLRNENITLVVHGVGGMKVEKETKRYLLKIRVKTPKGTLKAHELVCYGLDRIADIQQHVSPEELQMLFPDVPLHELKRPKQVDLLISHREGRLAPQKVSAVGDLVLWDGPLGKTVGGAHPDLFEEVTLSASTSKTHFARSMRTAAVHYEELPTDIKVQEARTGATKKNFLDWWKWDSIGAACEPKCGGCRCGNCQPGGKDMTLGEERELEVVKEGLTYVTEDNHSKDPHWHASYPWLDDPVSLPNNKSAVEATYYRTEKQLAKTPQWKTAYTAQVHDMLNRGAAVKLSEETLLKWSGPVWYVSHLIAPNPHSVTTPVRLVWNSSQKFRGVSLNDMLMKGPDVLNQIRAVLLRFRGGKHAALGDIKKMYNSVWLEDREVHMHRFLWRDSEHEELGEYAITRVNIGDKPAGCIAQVAMRETANLPSFRELEEERQVLHRDSYVDDILTSHDDEDRLKTITANVQKILKAGGFELKPWVYSGQSGRGELVNKPTTLPNQMVLPNQMQDSANKALGLGYLVEEDKLHVMVAINFSKRKQKMRLGEDLLEVQIQAQTPNPLTRRQLLSQISGLYDPIGLVTPAKQKGAILVRRAFQEAKCEEQPVKDTWDMPLTSSLREDAISIFEEYARLGKVTFPRALTPSQATDMPMAITFSDGSENAYGAVLYLRWNSDHGPVIRLAESKAKLTPLDQKGDTIKSEMCGAVFASRLKKYFETHSTIKVEKWYHFVDSQTILGAIQRESYGYKTFFANRIGEIQSSTNIEDWCWIPGHENIADLVTRGASPQNLDENSTWQNGTMFLRTPVKDWPLKSAKDLADNARQNINKMQKKAFVLALTRAQAAKLEERSPEKTGSQNRIEPEKVLARPAVQSLVDASRFSDLDRLITTVALVWRAAKKFLGPNRTAGKSKWEAVSEHGTISARERQDALRDILLAEQNNVTFQRTTTDRLVIHKDQDSGLLVCGGRIQVFKEDHICVPILPYTSWISTLLAREAHSENHEGVAGTLLKMRRKAWVVRGRRLAQKAVDSCITCRKKAKRCQQIMADLPPERARPAAPFEYTSVDLFGPYHVKDDVKKRVSLKVWGVVFCCMASRAIHTELVSTLSTEGFLLAYLRFTATRGHPRKVWSDAGTNFVGAKSILNDLYKFLNEIEKRGVEEIAAKHGTEWSWQIHPADSPHRNGAAEAAVRVVKRALQNLLPSSLTFSEFQSCLQIAANLVNEQPIDARVQSREDCIQYLTPNTLLLGRSSHEGDIKHFDFSSYPLKRLNEMQSHVNSFWRKWSQLAGPNLFIRSKWHTKQRNVAVGDVVWVADQNALRAQYKLGRVVSTNPDPKGIVRDVNIRVIPSYIPTTPCARETTSSPSSSKDTPAVILHRDVRRLVILLPVEEQA